mgnify:CR=1 FL=1
MSGSRRGWGMWDRGPREVRHLPELRVAVSGLALHPRPRLPRHLDAPAPIPGLRAETLAERGREQGGGARPGCVSAGRGAAVSADSMNWFWLLGLTGVVLVTAWRTLRRRRTP